MNTLRNRFKDFKENKLSRTEVDSLLKDLNDNMFKLSSYENRNESMEIRRDEIGCKIMIDQIHDYLIFGI